MYYLQSRYYDPDLGRFLNADEAMFILLPDKRCGYNIFVYCNNYPVNMNDETGFYAAPIIAMIIKFIGLCTMALIAYHALAAIVSSPSFQKTWTNMCTGIGNGLSWLGNMIVNGGKAAWNWSVTQIQTATTALSNYISFTQSETNIRKKIKKNSKSRYWIANVINAGGYKYATISSPISFNVAKSLASAGISIFTVTKYEARVLAQRFSGVSGPELGQKRDCCKQYWHYHILNKAFKNQHIFYLF